MIRLFPLASKAPKRFLRAEGGSHHNLTSAYFDDYRRAVLELFQLELPAAASTAANASPAPVSSATGRPAFDAAK